MSHEDIPVATPGTIEEPLWGATHTNSQRPCWMKSTLGDTLGSVGAPGPRQGGAPLFRGAPQSGHLPISGPFCTGDMMTQSTMHVRGTIECLQPPIRCPLSYETPFKGKYILDFLAEIPIVVNHGL